MKRILGLLTLLFCCSGLLVANQLDKSQSTDVALQYHQHIEELKYHYANTQFDLDRRDHKLRNERIAFYIEKAQDLHNSNWSGQRDDMISRAEKILNHHYQKTTETL